jgi:hypothetical protein
MMLVDASNEAAMLRCSEPNFAELLADPMIRLLMTSDRVSERELSGIADAARARVLESRRSPAPPTPRPARAARADLRKPH